MPLGGTISLTDVALRMQVVQLKIVVSATGLRFDPTRSAVVNGR